MENSMLNNLLFDPAYLLIALAVLTIILLITVIICIIKIKKMYRKYDMFMRGKDAETLEDVILEQIMEIKQLRAEDRANKDAVKKLSKKVKSAYQKFGAVKYNAFKGMGGNLSFAFALLDENNSGVILNAVHSREGCYLYMKEVKQGETSVLLGNEEKEALEEALGY